MAMDDFDSGVAAKPNLDEDLFDFPPMEVEAAPVEEVVEAAAEEPAPEAASVAEVTFAADTTPATPAGGYTGMDAELDVDIFDFPPIEDDTPAEPLALAGGDIEASIDEAAQTVNDLLEDDLGEMIQDHHEEAVRKMQAEEVACQTPAPSAPQLSADEDEAPAPAHLAQPIQAVAVAGLPSRLQWVLVGAVSVFMLGLLLIAWQLTSAFSRSLDQVRDEVAESTQALQTQNAEQIERIDDLQSELLASQALANQAMTSNVSGSSPPAIRTPSELTMLAANSAIESHDYSAARRMLFRDLANADSIPAEERDEMTQKMEFLIARSYLLESQMLAEEGR